MKNAHPIKGVYNVSWNSIAAVEEAVNTDVKMVYALDWGVFYPGVAMSRKDQKWEMEQIRSPQDFGKLYGAQGDMGFAILFKTSGDNGWILKNALMNVLGIISTKIFHQHPGEVWAFAVLHPPADVAPHGAEDVETDSNGVRNATFEMGELFWRHDKYELYPECANVSYNGEGINGGRAAVLTHLHDADSRIIQPVVLKSNTVYEVSAFVRTQDVGARAKGAHLCFMDHYIESTELHGDTDWQCIAFYVLNNTRTDIIAKVAGRLGTYGSMNSGKVWFDDFSVKPSNREKRNIPFFSIEK